MREKSNWARYSLQRGFTAYAHVTAAITMFLNAIVLHLVHRYQNVFYNTIKF